MSDGLQDPAGRSAPQGPLTESSNGSPVRPSARPEYVSSRLLSLIQSTADGIPSSLDLESWIAGPVGPQAATPEPVLSVDPPQALDDWEMPEDREDRAPIAQPEEQAPARPSGPPEYLSIGNSTIAHLKAISWIAATCMILGVAYGVLRPPIYTAQAKLIVGKSVSITNVAATAGLTAAEDGFASDYSRLVNTATVTNDAAKRLGHPNTLGGSLSASPVENSPIILVDAKASSQKAAVALANAGAAALVDDVTAINTSTSAANNGLYQDYKQIGLAIIDDTNKINSLKAQIAAGGPDVASLTTQLNAVQADLSAQQLQSQTVANQYQAQYSPETQEEQTVQSASPASPQGNDRKTFIEIGLMAGLFGGAILAVAGFSAYDMKRAGRLKFPTVPQPRSA